MKCITRMLLRLLLRIMENALAASRDSIMMPTMGVSAGGSREATSANYTPTEKETMDLIAKHASSVKTYKKIFNSEYPFSHPKYCQRCEKPRFINQDLLCIECVDFVETERWKGEYGNINREKTGSFSRS